MHRGRWATRAGADPALLVVMVLSSLFAFGCDRTHDSTTSPESRRTVSADAARERPPNEELAQYLAIALQDEGVRRGLLRAMAASTFSEGKVFLHADMAGPLNGLVAHMAKAGGVSIDQVRALIRQAPPLEMYLPVAEHRARWGGDSDYLVATVIEEGATPFGVNSLGEEIPLSAEVPPPIPTIVLVPAESFTKTGQPRRQLLGSQDIMLGMDCGSRAIQYCGSGGSGTWGPPENAVWVRGIGIRERISHFRYWDQHEGWPNGLPEFYILLAGTSDTDPGAELTKRINLTDDIWDDYDTGEWRLWDVYKLIDWDVDYGTRVRIQCFESDGQPDFSFSVSGNTVLAGVNVQFQGSFMKDSGDDKCGVDDLKPRFSDGSWSFIPDGPGGNAPIFDGTSDLQWYGYGIDVTP